MKCPKCGYVTSEHKHNCGKCGYAFPAGRAITPGGTPPPPAPDPDPSSLKPESIAEVPEWRKQVTEKVRAYGEKKKYLTTPPQPLKPASAEPLAERVDSKALVQDKNPPGRAPISPTRVAPAAEPSLAPPVDSAQVSADPAIQRPARIILPVEIQAGDLSGLDLEDEEGEGISDSQVLYLGRRAVSFLVDTLILVALHFFLIYICAEIIGFSYQQMLRQAWEPLAGVFLLFHCVYYLYFYRTSRQTPGQVFVAVELRDPMSGNVSAGRILIRWAAMVFLNIFNLLPLLKKRNYLLLDRLSGTEIRKLR
jgi:uncharacterized RDD family membrane protein YckC